MIVKGTESEKIPKKPSAKNLKAKREISRMGQEKTEVLLLARAFQLQV